jgi:hypothetical protein
LDDFKRQIQLDEQLSLKIRQYLLNNYRIISTANEEEKLLTELPDDLKGQIFIKAFGKVVEKVKFLKDCESNEFVWATIQLAKERKFIQNEIIYQRGDSFYMIYEGRVTLQAHNEQPIIQYDDGQLVGDSDALMELPRDCKAYANYKVTVLYQIKMDQMDDVLKNFPDEHYEMLKAA